MKGCGIRFADLRLYVRLWIWYYSRRQSSLLNPTAMRLSAQVTADTILSQSTQHGPYSRNNLIDASNGSALMEDVTGGARTVAACGHWAQTAADINPWSMEQRSSWEVDSLSRGRLFAIANSVTLPATAYHLSLTTPHESNPYSTPRLTFSFRKVLRPATSTQVFLGFPVSVSKCWDGSHDSKLPLHASHVALPT